MRFFKDDQSIILPVRWYFTDPAAEWVGFSNGFDSRNWYLDSPEQWPDIGEVQGAPRRWVDGKNPCVSNRGPIGSSDQWADGALVSERVDVDPCRGPLVQGYPNFQPQFTWFGGQFPCTQVAPDKWAANVTLGLWLVLQKVSDDPACCMRATGRVYQSSGPPLYADDLFAPLFIVESISGCNGMFYSPDGQPPSFVECEAHDI
jgi:hypothetical protein